jgi:hypothetical protein
MGRSTPYSRIRSPCSSSMVARLSISHFRRRQIARRLVSSADRHRDERHHPRPRRRARIGARAIGRQLERVPRCLYRFTEICGWNLCRPTSFWLLAGLADSKVS